MDTPGNFLKTEREKQKKSLEDIEHLLKINIEYLRAIEEDDYERLPGDIFVRSYLRSYAKALGLEADPVLRLYNKCFIEPAATPQPPKKPMHDLLSRLKPVYIYVLPACIILALIMVAFYTKDDTPTPEPAPVMKKSPDIKPEKPVKEVPAVPEKPYNKETTTEAAAQETRTAEEELTLKITATELTWVSVRIDSGSAEEILLRAGDTRTVTAREKFVIKVGNAGGTSLSLNGTDIGTLGPHGQVADITLP